MEDNRLTAAELLCAREYLALPKAWLAEHVEVNLKTWWAYEAGRVRVPVRVTEAIRNLLEHTAQVVAGMTVMVSEREGPINLATFPDSVVPNGFPASWHRMVCARVAERTGQRIVWRTDAAEVEQATAS